MESATPGRPGTTNKTVAKASVGPAKSRDAANRKIPLTAKDKDAPKMTSLLTGGAPSDDLGAVYRATQEGITIAALIEFAKSVQMFTSDYLLVTLTGLSERTIQRRKQSPAEPLSSEQGARAFRVAQILEQAIRVMGTPELAEAWMLKPAIGLDNRRPIDLLDNSIGTQLVGELLTRLEYGVYQ